jgi:hypothetical protein
MGCWEVVDVDTSPQDANLIGVKWVFKINYKNGEYERHKARIVTLGYQQCKNADIFASFSPTASYVTIRLCKRRSPNSNYARKSMSESDYISSTVMNVSL